MGQCGEITDPGIECCQPAVLYGKCEAHLTDRERAVLELVRRVDAVMDGFEDEAWTEWVLLRRAIAAVKESV